VPQGPSLRPALAADATGEEVYRAACLTCHGPDGTGSARTVVGFDTPLPDFTDCAFASAEADGIAFRIRPSAPQLLDHEAHRAIRRMLPGVERNMDQRFRM